LKKQTSEIILVFLADGEGNNDIDTMKESISRYHKIPLCGGLEALYDTIENSKTSSLFREFLAEDHLDKFSHL
jgi:hypothetical protein